MRIAEEDINAIRSSADIVDIIGHFLPLVRKGKGMSAVCPFHDDHDPSLSISQDKQMYKCFVCQKGGNVFTFVQDFEKISFVEAVVKVAQIIDYPLHVEVKEVIHDPRQHALHKCMQEAISYMSFQLHASEGANASSYLVKRGLNKEIMEMFEIGFNGPNNQVVKFLQAKGFSEADIVACNIGRWNDVGIADVFFNRIAFPIHDARGNPVAFSARTMDPNVQSKYINSNENELYTKGQIIYNYHRAKQHVKRAGYIILCEGVMDVIAFARAGIYNAVATLGTACTPEQIRLLKQSSRRVVLCYDADNAGQKATLKVAKEIIAVGCEVTIVNNATGLDPDDIVNKYGPEELKSMLDHPLTWIEFVFEQYKKQFNLENYSDKKQFTQLVKTEIDCLKDDFDRQEFTHRLSQLTGFSLSQLKSDVSVAKQVKSVARVRLKPIESGKMNAESTILSQMLLSNQACEIFKKQLGFLASDLGQQCAILIVDQYRKNNQLNVADLINQCTSDEQRRKIIALSTDEMYVSNYDEDLLRGAIRRFRAALLKEQIDEMQTQIKTITNLESKAALILEKTQLQRELGALMNEE